LEAAKQIALMDEFQDAAAQSTIADYIEDKSPKAKTVAKAPVKAKAPTKAKAAKVVENEDAPF
jgi:phage FluMu protein Com